MSDPETLRLSTPAERVLTITLARPEASNAFNTLMAEELTEALGALAADVRCVILTGEGERAFCAGADLKEREGMSEAAWRAQHKVFEAMGRALRDLPVPLIGAVNGAAYGGGCEIALLCDFVYAASNARFALTETTLGTHPGPRRHPDPDPRGGLPTGQGSDPHRPAVHRPGRHGLGHGQPPVRARGPAAPGERDRRAHRRQRAPGGAGGQARHRRRGGPAPSRRHGP